MTERDWDKKRKIATCGRMADHEDEYHYPYEPTPYPVLVRLAESGYIGKEHKVMDYGCGKGRVGFFLHYKLGCSVVGVEYEEKIYEQARDNLRNYVRGTSDEVEFVCRDAKDLSVKDADRFYLFNPFSLEILQSVLGRVLESYYENSREMQLFFYYPSDEYVAFLMTQDELMFVDEIDCSDLFDGENQRERILIFEVI